MKILILTNYANGLYLFRKELLQTFSDKGYETIVSVPEDENCNKLEHLGTRLICTELERRGSNPFKDLKLFDFYKKMLKNERPDIVLTYTIKPNIYGGMACRIKKIPYVVNVTGLGTALEGTGFMSKMLVQMYKSAVKSAKCVFYQNKDNMSFMERHGIKGRQQILLPGSGVNLDEHPEEPYPDEQDGIIFLAVIRIMKDKGIDEYLETAKNISSRYPKTKFYLVGEYEEETRPYYERLVAYAEKNGYIRYFGHIDTVPQMMAKCHVIIHPSYHEGLSNVLLEAAACARPVLASDVPGCRETLMPGESGILFEPKSTEKLTQAVCDILAKTPEERRQMGVAGRRYIEQNFDRQIVVEKYLEQIESI
ncbi:MAG: glycosyltransferase family 4 protein [Lachnospiraceae bacterium]|jgi:galacturonosyltransferase|nr:glycosyltransferase family 4 protein [Lachnospiraceae bacterium]